MYRMYISYVKDIGYKISKEYESNGYHELFETLKGLTKQEVNEIIESNNLYEPYYNGTQIGILY